MQVIETSIGEEEKAGANLLSERARALDDAVSRYRPMFYRKAFQYLGNAPDAEDAVQDALLSACKHLSLSNMNTSCTASCILIWTVTREAAQKVTMSRP